MWEKYEIKTIAKIKNQSNPGSVIREKWFNFQLLHGGDRSNVPIEEGDIIWAAPWENLFLPYTNNKGADQPAHPRSLISTFVVRSLDTIMPLVSISKISSVYLASVAAQAGLRLSWSETPKTGFLVTRLISRLPVLMREVASLCHTQPKWGL